MIITGIDTETTSIEYDEGHRIIEIAMVCYDFATRRPRLTFEQRIHPGRSITADAIEVHGITLDMLEGYPMWETVAPKVHKVLQHTDLLIGHNVMFDAKFVVGELRRVGLEPPNLDVFCTMEKARWATPLGKLPSLGELCFALDIPFDPERAHGALYDIEVTMQCFFAGLDRGFYKIDAPAKEKAT